MHILDIRRDDGAGATVARFDIELSEHVRLYNMRLVPARQGGYRVYPPSAFGSNVATFSPALTARIATLAVAAFGERDPHDQRAA
jgi:hypothetical protein